jgi:hypothetical protein
MGEELQESWRNEFKALGSEGVRREIMLARWPQDKLSAARHWVQLEEVTQWQRQAPTLRQGASSNWLRTSARYVFPAIAALYAAARLIRLMRHGV